MTDAVQPVTTTTSTATSAAVANAPTSVNVFVQPVASDPAVQVASQLKQFSPRFVNDATAGLIIQYLGSNGDVQSQIPSAKAVAYLKFGLDVNGEKKTDPHAIPEAKSQSVVA